MVGADSPRIEQGVARQIDEDDECGCSLDREEKAGKTSDETSSRESGPGVSG
jgi:hypothetical protein